jgi:glycerol-3-phosphate acyltransferase PlsY
VPVLCYIIVALVAYLLGSIPFGFLAARARGIDIRAMGSGNIGATNAMRVLGKPMGIAVLLLDAFKGWSACFAGALICAAFSPADPAGFAGAGHAASVAAPPVERMAVVAGIFAVLGHNYTCWLRFKGGKGIATTAGVYVALAPVPLLIALLVFLLAVAFTRYVSVGSMAAAVALAAAVWVMTPHQMFLGIVTTALGALAIYKHKSNIRRLLAGTENRLGRNNETTR